MARDYPVMLAIGMITIECGSVFMNAPRMRCIQSPIRRSASNKPAMLIAPGEDIYASPRPLEIRSVVRRAPVAAAREAGARAGNARRGGTLTVAMQNDAKSLDRRSRSISPNVSRSI
jgi:hypothetical protein